MPSLLHTYPNKPLKIRLLLENTGKHTLKGVLRPQCYIMGTGKYSSLLRLNLLNQEILPGGKEVVSVLLESPAGFGEALKVGVLLTIKDGITPMGKGVILEIGEAHF